DAYRKFFETAEAGELAPRRRPIGIAEAESGESREETLQYMARFHACERRARADVGTPANGKVARSALARDVEFICVREGGLVAIGRAQEDVERRATAHGTAR